MKLLFVLLLNYISRFFSKLPEIDQIIYINSSDFIVVVPKQINFINGIKPKYWLNFPSTIVNGNFYQVSNIFSTHGYKPYQGTQIFNSTQITGNKGMFVYKPNTLFNSQTDLKVVDIVDLNIWLIDNNRKNITLEGKIVFLPNSGIFVSSNFLLKNDGWKIVGNNPIHTPIQEPIYCNWNYNNFSMFITGTDNYINLHNNYLYDKSKWYFKAPDKYNTDLSLAYGGYIKFTQMFFSGDFSKLNNLENIPLIKIQCSKFSYSLNYFFKNKINSFENKFIIKFDEKYWNKSYNLFNNYYQLSKSEFVECLRNIDSLEILGDWTIGLESVGLDSVSIYK